MLDITETEFDVDTSFYGRVRNLSLPANQYNSLVPLFEAIMNAIHGIEDKYGSLKLSKGQIKIFIHRDAKEEFVEGFTIADNGIGLDDRNLKSFFKSDSMYKIERGGKGVGRLSWLKAFKNTHIQSVHKEDDDFIETRFDFLNESERQIRGFIQSISEQEKPVTGAIVKLHPYHSTFSNVCPKKSATIVNKIISHFLSYFLTTNVPKITIDDLSELYDLNDMTASMQSEEVEYDLTVDHPNGELKSFKLNCFKIKRTLADDENGNNAIYYIANGRVVKRIALDKALGLKTIGDDLVFCGTVTGEYCDETANQERTSFNWSEEFFSTLHTGVVDHAKDYLQSEIKEIRNVQAEKIEKVGKEHPRFFSYVKNAKELANDLSLGTQGEEEIFLEMSRRSLRAYKKRKREYSKAAKTRRNLDEEAKNFTEHLQHEALSSLAECVYKRKLILELMDSKMEYLEGQDKNKALEESVHEIICPLGVDSDDIGYNDHNLWVVDDNLAFYSYFGSDQSLKRTTKGGVDSAKEPDILFFDESLGFNRDKSDQPITIVEFKRPGRNDYNAKDNPITQVRKYVQEMRDNKSAKTDRGREIRAVDENTHFLCHIIADTESTLIQQMKDYGPFHKRAGHNSYYKWDEPYKIFIEVSSYEEVLSSAKARHEEFFEKLGINN